MILSTSYVLFFSLLFSSACVCASRNKFLWKPALFDQDAARQVATIAEKLEGFNEVENPVRSTKLWYVVGLLMHALCGISSLCFSGIGVFTPVHLPCFFSCRGKWRLVFTSSSPMIKNKGVTGLGSIPFVSFVVSAKPPLSSCFLWFSPGVKHMYSSSALLIKMFEKPWPTTMKMKAFIVPLVVECSCKYIFVQASLYPMCELHFC
jgi:hypothetical protein